MIAQSAWPVDRADEMVIHSEELLDYLMCHAFGGLQKQDELDKREICHNLLISCHDSNIN